MVAAGHHLLSACHPCISATTTTTTVFSLLTTIGMRRMVRLVSCRALVSPLPPVALPLNSLIWSAKHRSQTSFWFAASDE